MVLPEATANGQARSHALSTAGRNPVRPTGLIDFRSAGFALVVGEAQRVRDAAARLGEKLEITTLVRSKEVCTVKIEQTGSQTQLFAKPAELTGHLGNFQLTLDTPKGEIDLKAATDGWRDHFDLVLDLCQPPLIDSALPPIGYFAPGEAPDSLEAALAELPTLVGDFEKPQYFQYDPAICAHGRSGIKACTQCIDTCPADAIVSIGEQIQVDPNLCQGAGVCATACPTGAIRYAYPDLGDTLDRIRRLLKAFHSAGGSGACLLFYGSEGGSDQFERVADRLPENVFPLEVEEIGSVGMDVWLSALAYGAGQVCLLAESAVPEPVVDELEAQLTYARALLEGMGYSAELVSLVQAATDDQLLRVLDSNSAEPGLVPAGFAAVNEKRTMLRLAIDHLYERAPARRPLVTLPSGAPFGEVTVDEGRCTLCMACVSQCPGRALEAGGEEPQLKFIEENCVQCAMCSRTCPEDAIAPSPRYLFDMERRRERRILKEEEVFNCVSCGKPFSTRSMIDQMTAKLRSHPMFQGNALRRLQMCEDCRVRAMYADELAELDADGPEGDQS